MAERPDPEAVQRIVEQVRPLLAGRGPQVQGAVCADLLALWLAGHPEEVREQLLQLTVTTVRALIAISDDESVH